VTVDLLGCSVYPQYCFICQGMKKPLTATALGGVAPFTYKWSDGSTGATLVTGTPGVYTVTVTDANGCTSTCWGEIVVDTLGCLITPSCCENDLKVCNGSSVQLCGSSAGGLAPFQYVWSTGESTACITVTQPGVYTLTVADANGCTGIQSVTVGSCAQCVTRDSVFWSSHIVTPPRTTGPTCATLQNVFTYMPSGLMNLGFMQVTLNQALGIYWGNQTGPGDNSGRSGVCSARKNLAREIISAIANETLLNTDSSLCGVQDPSTGEFISLATLIAEAQAATQPTANVADCNNQLAWVQQMNSLAALLSAFNASGTSLPVPATLQECGIGSANSNYIFQNQVDPTTAANCACP